MGVTLGVIIVAAGSGERMGGLDKLLTEVGGKPLLAHAITPFQQSAAVGSIVVVMSPQNLKRGREVVEQYGFTRVSALVKGGRRRQDSVRAGLDALGECEYVAVHDGGRPLVTVELIERGFTAAIETGAALPGVRIADTVKEAGHDGMVVRTVHRSRLWAIQTPQVFRRDLLERAHREVTEDVTDDAAMLEALGIPVHIYPGEPWNLKITLAEDLDMARGVIERSASQADSERG